VGEPEEIAKAAVFLASADASFIAGIELLSTVVQCKSSVGDIRDN
jgi:NAD(P)-dependent dehydrogenase (short-subunit alcohol dehydrogenase family)